MYTGFIKNLLMYSVFRLGYKLQYMEYLIFLLSYSLEFRYKSLSSKRKHRFKLFFIICKTSFISSLSNQPTNSNIIWSDLHLLFTNYLPVYHFKKMNSLSKLITSLYPSLNIVYPYLKWTHLKSLNYSHFTKPSL